MHNAERLGDYTQNTALQIRGHFYLEGQEEMSGLKNSSEASAINNSYQTGNAAR